MQLANIQLALGGDPLNTVYKGGEPPPRFPVQGQTSRGCVTAAEIPVLQMIHGADAVTDIEPAGEWPIGNREERARLASLYGKAEGNPPRPAANCPVTALYPGIAARVHDRLDDLGLPEEFYKTTTRLNPRKDDEDGGDGQGPRQRWSSSGEPGGSEIGGAAGGGDQGGPSIGESSSGGRSAVAVGRDGHGSTGQQGSARRGKAGPKGAGGGVGSGQQGVAEAVYAQEEVESDGIREMPDKLFG